MLFYRAKSEDEIGEVREVIIEEIREVRQDERRRQTELSQWEKQWTSQWNNVILMEAIYAADYLCCRKMLNCCCKKLTSTILSLRAAQLFKKNRTPEERLYAVY